MAWINQNFIVWYDWNVKVIAPLAGYDNETLNKKNIQIKNCFDI